MELRRKRISDSDLQVCPSPLLGEWLRLFLRAVSGCGLSCLLSRHLMLYQKEPRDLGVRTGSASNETLGHRQAFSPLWAQFPHMRQEGVGLRDL